VTETSFSNRILGRFVETAAVQLGPEQLTVMLSLSKLPAEWAKPETFKKMDANTSAQTYAALQAAMRTYFGRGARGVLLRVGQRLWDELLKDASLAGKAQAVVVKGIPLNARRKSTLELLARLLGAKPGDITVHTLDLDLLLADHVSPATDGCSVASPICFVTQGLIRESLYWATGQNHDVEETSCKASGASSCEFKIITGRK
jgi:predicted hydrocarbon binding protein